MNVRIRPISAGRFWFIAAVMATVLSLSACGHPGLKDNAEHIIQMSATVDGMKNRRNADPQVWEKPSYYLTRNGNAVYVEPKYGGQFGKQFYTNCDYHWEVNPQGRVVGYLTVGPKCTWYRGRNDTDPRLVEGATRQWK